jgi:non-ribosomal peptide synthetase component E (peptide arylation enzyme)
MSFNLATILNETSATAPDAPVCLVGGETMTYRELDELSGRFAAGLRESGLKLYRLTLTLHQPVLVARLMPFGG